MKKDIFSILHESMDLKLELFCDDSQSAILPRTHDVIFITIANLLLSSYGEPFLKKEHVCNLHVQ
jgi:hypothetical protein